MKINSAKVGNIKEFLEFILPTLHNKKMKKYKEYILYMI
jgi:hypothetical protein